MISLKTATQILSPYDVLEIVVESREIIRKDEENFDPTSILVRKVNPILHQGTSCQKNPTYYKIAEGKKSSEISNWNDLLISELKNSSHHSVKVTDLDNNTNVVEVMSSIHLAILNCAVLTKEQIKEIKCAKAFTPYGQIEISL